MIPNTRPQCAAGPSHSVNTHPVQTNKWAVNSQQADLTEMLQSSLTNMSLTNPPPTRPTHPPAGHANGPPVNTQYQYQPPQQGVYLPLPAWIQGKGSVPPLYQEVTTQCADPRQSYYILTNKIQPVLLSSGLDKTQLKAIWDICSRTAAGFLTLTECYTVLGLIALVQQGHEIELDKLVSLSFVPIPRIDTSVLYQQPTNQFPNTYPPQPVAANVEKQTQSFGEFKSADNDNSFGNFQSDGSEFGTFQSAVTQIPVNNVKEKTQESPQLHRNSPVPINDSSLSTTSNSDKYSCFRDVDNKDTFSPIETADSGSDDKYAFLRALSSGQTGTLPSMSITQPTQSADTPAVVTNNTMQDFSIFNTTSTVQPQTNIGAILSTVQVPVATKGHFETTLIPDRNVVKSDFSEFSAFQSADTNRSIPDKEPVSTETDWNAFTSTTLLNSSNTATPENDEYSIFSQLQSADQNEAVLPADSSKSQTMTTETDRNAFKSTALQNDSNTATPENDKYSIFSQLQSADQNEAVLPADSSKSQTMTTETDRNAFKSTALQNDSNTATPENDKYSIFSQLQSADQNEAVLPADSSKSQMMTTETDRNAFKSTALQNDSNTATPENDKYSIFSQLQSADQNEAVLPADSSKSQTMTTETDRNAFKSTALQNDSNTATPENDKYSIFSQLQSADQNEAVLPADSSKSQTMTTETDRNAFKSTALQNDNNTATPENDKYSIFSQLQSADQLPNELSILSTNTGEIQTTTQTDWNVLTPSTLQNDNSATTLEKDKYSVFSQLQSADQYPTSLPPIPTPSYSSTVEEVSNKEAVAEQKITGSNEILPDPNKPYEFTDFAVFQSTAPLLPTSNPLQPTPVNNNNNTVVNTNTALTAAISPPEIVATGPVSKSEKQETRISAVSTSDTINRNTVEESNFNEPPPLDDVPNTDTNDEDLNLSGFNSFLTNDSYQTPESKPSQQGSLTTDTNPQSLSFVLQSAALEEFNDIHNEDTPLATPSSHFPDTAHTPPPTHDVTEPDVIEERTPLADKTLTLQDVGVSEQEINFSVFSQFQTLPKTEELDCNYSDCNSQSRGENDFILSSNNKLSQNQEFSEFSSFQKPSDSSVFGETLEESEHNLNPVPDPFQDLSLLQTSDLMKGQPSNLQQPKWTLFDTLSTALQDLNSVPIDHYKNQKFQAKKEPISEIQQEESFSRRSPLPPERELDFGEFTGATKTYQVVTRAPSYKLSEDSSKEIRETWSLTLSASARVIHFCYEKVKSATSVQILKELCSHETSHQYFLAVFEVIKIVCRIKKLLPANWEDSNSLYDDITGDWANIKAYLNHGELEFSDIVVSIESETDESPCHCGVCLDVVVKGDVNIELGGYNYHNTCANFWLNEVGSILPRLSMESHGLSI